MLWVCYYMLLLFIDQPFTLAGVSPSAAVRRLQPWDPANQCRRWPLVTSLIWAYQVAYHFKCVEHVLDIPKTPNFQLSALRSHRHVVEMFCQGSPPAASRSWKTWCACKSPVFEIGRNILGKLGNSHDMLRMRCLVFLHKLVCLLRITGLGHVTRKSKSRTAVWMASNL